MKDFTCVLCTASVLPPSKEWSIRDTGNCNASYCCKDSQRYWDSLPCRLGLEGNFVPLGYLHGCG